jgi:hypothetical protein
VQVERLLRRRVPVRAELAGAPALGYMTAESSVRPAEVEVAGPKSKVEDLKEIRTEPIDMQGMERGFQRNTLLAWAGDLVSFTPDPRRSSSVSVEEVSVSREFKDVPVTVTNSRDRQVSLDPPRADVTPQRPAAHPATTSSSRTARWSSTPNELEPGTHKREGAGHAARHPRGHAAAPRPAHPRHRRRPVVGEERKLFGTDGPSAASPTSNR